ncbi:MAG: MurR/RpiR family transcriptional regulator [Thermotogae bacterium]|nr:MurR/RpiR family transcriptional regulator [Thermotogota bacterium]
MRKLALKRIRSRLSDFTRIEKHIANYILTKPKDVLYMTVNELANASGVSDASVIRFVRTLEFDSFQSFKLALAGDLFGVHEEFEDPRISAEDDMNRIVEKTKSGCMKSIESTMSVLDMDMLKMAVNLINNARRVECYGVGSSAAVAQIIQYKFIRLGLPCKAYDDPHIQAMSASTMSFGDVAIGVSHSGSTKDTVDSVKVAKEHGASTICITDHVKSPISKYADVILETFSRESPIKSGAGRSIIAQIFVVETLTNLLYQLNRERAEKYGKESARAVSNKLY